MVEARNGMGGASQSTATARRSADSSSHQPNQVLRTGPRFFTHHLSYVASCASTHLSPNLRVMLKLVG